MLVTTAGCIVARMETIGSRIAAARERKGLNQSELGRLLGVTPQSVQAWESDKNIPRPKRLNQIAGALGSTVAELVGDSQMPDLETDPAESSAAELVRQMLASKAGKSLSQEDRERLLAVTQEPQEKPSNVIPADFSRNQARKGELLIPEFDIRAAMGAGQLPGDYVETVRNLVVNEAHLRAHGVNYSAPEHLAMITGWGESMTPTINDKDPVMVDRGVNEFIGEGLYVLTWHKHLFIKRVQLLDAEHFNLISDNDRYPNQTAKIEDVIFHAKVLLIWNARKG
ncbi:helix-turn-helix protein [compost metagenome]